MIILESTIRRLVGSLIGRTDVAWKDLTLIYVWKDLTLIYVIGFIGLGHEIRPVSLNYGCDIKWLSEPTSHILLCGKHYSTIIRITN